MNKTIENFARITIEANLTQCTDAQRDTFRRMYGHDLKSKQEGQSPTMAEIIDHMDASKLDTALSQVEGTIRKNKAQNPQPDPAGHLKTPKEVITMVLETQELPDFLRELLAEEITKYLALCLGKTRGPGQPIAICFRGGTLAWKVAGPLDSTSGRPSVGIDEALDYIEQRIEVMTKSEALYSGRYDATKEQRFFQKVEDAKDNRRQLEFIRFFIIHGEQSPSLSVRIQPSEQ